MAYGKQVSFSSASGKADGYLSRPGQGRPGVIVIQEWWGLVPHVKDVTDRFAAQGYVALAPDLYHGKSTVEAEEAHHLMTGLDWGRAVEEIAGAVRYLRDTEGVDRVGVVGFCMGGALTVLSATLPGVDAYVAFYGFPPADAAGLDRITAPGEIYFGEHEAFFSVPDAQAFAERQRRAGREAEVVIYPGAGHAFFNNDRPEVFQREAANEAWRRTLGHFGRHLRAWTNPD
jgi:carboxymethylenebutenolidase